MGQEGEAQARRAVFEGVYQINAELMALAHPGCMVQHCLPAHRGEEITAEVFEAHANEIFDEAENRLHAQKAVMYLLMGSSNGLHRADTTRDAALPRPLFAPGKSKPLTRIFALTGEVCSDKLASQKRFL